MGSSRSYSALASALLIGTLALTGCSAANNEKAQEAAASATASAAQANLDGIQTLADDYATAMTTSVDAESVRSAFTDDEKQKISDTLGKVSPGSGSDQTASSVTDSISALSSEEKDLLKRVLSSETHKAESLIDYSNLNEDQKLALNLIDFSLQISTSRIASSASKADNKVNLTELSLDGNKVEFPAATLTNLELVDDSVKDAYAHIPAVYVDGKWKIDGQKYLEKLESLAQTL